LSNQPDEIIRLDPDRGLASSTFSSGSWVDPATLPHPPGARVGATPVSVREMRKALSAGFSQAISATSDAA
jgi:hypothetical protein